MSTGYKWIKVEGSAASGYPGGIVVFEFEIYSAANALISTGGTPYGSRMADSGIPPKPMLPAYAFDGDHSTYFFGAESPSWVGYRKETYMPVYRVSFLFKSISNGKIMGSNDSVNGAGGTWDTLVTGINRYSASTLTWDHYYPTWGPNAYYGEEAPEPFPVSPAPIILSCLPASLRRGFL